jgi:hypothetical protein
MAPTREVRRVIKVIPVEGVPGSNTELLNQSSQGKSPNAMTIKAMRAADSGTGHRPTSPAAMFRKLKI